MKRLVLATSNPDKTREIEELFHGLSVRIVPVTDVVTADLDGDGVEEFVFGALDGRVVAVRSSDGSEAWSVAPGAFVSAPIVADFGSGPSLVVPAHDGTIRIYLFSQDASKG